MSYLIWTEGLNKEIRLLAPNRNYDSFWKKIKCVVQFDLCQVCKLIVEIVLLITFWIIFKLYLIINQFTRLQEFCAA